MKPIKTIASALAQHLSTTSNATNAASSNTVTIDYVTGSTTTAGTGVQSISVTNAGALTNGGTSAYSTWVGGPTISTGQIGTQSITWTPSITKEDLDKIVDQVKNLEERFLMMFERMQDCIEQIKEKVDTLTSVWCKTCGARLEADEVHICLAELGRDQVIEEQLERLAEKLKETSALEPRLLRNWGAEYRKLIKDKKLIKEAEVDPDYFDNR